MIYKQQKPSSIVKINSISLLPTTDEPMKKLTCSKVPHEYLNVLQRMSRVLAVINAKQETKRSFKNMLRQSLGCWLYTQGEDKHGSDIDIVT